MKSPNININIGAERKHSLKVLCAKKKTSITDTIIAMIDRYLDDNAPGKRLTKAEAIHKAKFDKQ